MERLLTRVPSKLKRRAPGSKEATLGRYSRLLTLNSTRGFPKGARRDARVYLTQGNTGEGVQAQAHSAATAATSTRKTEPGSIRYPRAPRRYHYRDYYVRGERCVRASPIACGTVWVGRRNETGESGVKSAASDYDGKLKEPPPLGNEGPTCCSARGGGYARGSGLSCPWG